MSLRAGRSQATLLGLSAAFVLLWASIFVLVRGTGRWRERVERQAETQAGLVERLRDEERRASSLEAQARALEDRAAAAEERQREGDAALARAERVAGLAHLKAARLALEAQSGAELQRALDSVPEDLRGFAHAHLDLCGSLRFARLADPDEDVLAVAFDGPGERLALGTREGNLRLLRHPSGELLWELASHEEEVLALTFDAAGEQLASGGLEGWVQLVAASDGSVRAALEFEEPVTALAFVDAGHLVVAGGTGRLVLWAPEGDPEVRELPGHTRAINAVTVSDDGRLIASGGDDYGVRVASGNGFLSSRLLEGHADWVRGVAFAPGAGTLTSVSEDGTARLWDVASGEWLGTRRPDDGELVAVLHGADAEEPVLVTGRGALLLPGTAPRVAFPLTTRQEVLRAAGDRTLTRVAIATGEAQVFVWDRAAPLPVTRRSRPMGDVRALDSTADGERFLTGSTDGVARLWDVAGDSDPRLFEGHSGPVYAAELSPDGATVATGDRSGALRLFDAGTGEVRSVLAGSKRPLVDVAFDPTGAEVVSVSRFGGMRRFRVADGELLSELPAPRSGVHAVALSADAARFVWVGDGGTVRLWDTRTGERLQGWRDRELARVDPVVLSPDGTRLAVVSNDYQVVVYDLASGERLAAFLDPDYPVRSLAFRPGGSELVTASRDGRMFVWDVPTSTRVLELFYRNEAIMALGFDAAGTRLFAGTADDGVQVWESDRAAFDALRR